MDSWIIGVIESMGYAGIALLMALENVVPPVPSELIMPLGGFTAAQGELSLPIVIVVGTLAALVGTLPWYAVGRWVGQDRVSDWVDRHGHWLTLDRDEVERAMRWFERHRWIITAGRLIPGVRTVVSLPAGFAAMGLPQYLAYSTIGIAAWTGLLAYLGYLLGAQYEQVAAYLGPVTWAVLGAAAATYVVRLVRMRARNHARRGVSSRTAP